MHYYQFNIADYRKDTVHLSRLEHSIYRDLIDWYYLDEAPIPKETQVVSRRLRLGSEEEAGALQNVLSDFFEEREDGYYHDRIEQEIASYHEMAEKNKKNGKKGGRPPKSKPKGNPEETEKNPVGSQSVATGNPNESQKNPNQEPLTNNQEPIVLESSKDDLLPDKPGSVTPLCPHQKIVDLYHEILEPTGFFSVSSGFPLGFDFGGLPPFLPFFLFFSAIS